MATVSHALTTRTPHVRVALPGPLRAFPSKLCSVLLLFLLPKHPRTA